MTDRTLRIIWLALVFSILIYIPMLYRLERRGVEPLSETYSAGIAAAAAALAAASLIYRQMKLSRGALEAALLRPAAETPMEPGGLSPAERRVLSVIGQISTPTIACLALNEGIAVLGFVLAFLSARPDAFSPFAAVAIALDVLVFPGIEGAAEKLFERAQYGGA